MKKLSIVLTLCLLSVFGFQADAKSKSVHAKAHQQQLAAARTTGLEKSTISRLVEEDIAERENASAIDAETSQLLDDLLSEARSHIGARYSRGSKGPKAFDCSGFSSYVYRQFGYELSASSSAQYTQGIKVSRTELRKGDLVFFKGRSLKRGVGHVGIVVDADENGNFIFIHAATSSGVIISNSHEPYYAKRYVGSKRVVGDNENN